MDSIEDAMAVMMEQMGVSDTDMAEAILAGGDIFVEDNDDDSK